MYNNFLKQAVYFILAGLLIFGCNKRSIAPENKTLPDSSRIKLDRFGDDNHLELLTWNIQNFPKAGQQTVTDVEEIIKDLDADIYAVEEIEDTLDFRELLDSLNGEYAGIYSDDVYSAGEYQKTGIIYRKQLIQISGKTMLFPHDSYAFPRPPLQVTVTAQQNGKIFDFKLIVLHLKAYDDASSRERRRRAVQDLKNYIDDQILNGSEPDFIVVGDWNDELSDTPDKNVFQVFLDDSQKYHFLTTDLLSESDGYTYIGWNPGSKIDQILVSHDALVEYDNGSTDVIRIDEVFKPYVAEVSDHRPVGAIFPVF